MSASVKPKGSNTAKANKAISERIPKELPFGEKLQFIQDALAEELKDLRSDPTTFEKRLVARGEQIVGPMLFKVFSINGEERYKQFRILNKEFKKLDPKGPLRKFIATHYIVQIAPELLPPDRKSLGSTRRKSPHHEGLGPPELGISLAANREITKRFGVNVNAIPPFIGVQCDPIGFQQHSGECATDSFQQLLLFADQWKAITQPLIYNMTPDTFETQYTSMPVVLRPKRDLLHEFFKNIQMRFRLHYSMIGTTKYAVNDECIEPFPYRRYLRELAGTNEGLTGALATRKRRLSANLGVTTKATLRDLEGSATPGKFSTNYMIKYFRRIWDFCGLDRYFFLVRHRCAPISKYAHLYLNHNHVAFYLASERFNPQNSIKPSLKKLGSNGHATAIYMCDGKWVYYDDNRGVMGIHPQLMDDILNEVDLFHIFWRYESGSNRILFFKVPILLEEDDEIEYRENNANNEDEDEDRDKEGDWSGRTLYQWNENRWNKIDYGFLADSEDIKYVYVIKRIIHLVTRNHSVPGYPGTHFIDNQTLTAPPLAETQIMKSRAVSVAHSGSKQNSLESPRRALRTTLANITRKRATNVNNTERALLKRIENVGTQR